MKIEAESPRVPQWAKFAVSRTICVEQNRDNIAVHIGEVVLQVWERKGTELFGMSGQQFKEKPVQVKILEIGVKKPWQTKLDHHICEEDGQFNLSFRGTTVVSLDQASTYGTIVTTVG